ncbi:MAG: TadE/TadG family protein [Rhizobiaceae bacterium]|nr:TadE/TadG family protein [Rhizobiaceae bacterium]
MHKRLAAFRADRRGNFGLISAFLAVPLVLGAGLMIDVSTISRTRAELQNAMDSAALAVAREGKKLTDAQAIDIADTFLDQNFDPKYTKLKVLRDGTEFRVEAHTRARLAFGALFGYEDWEVAAASAADIAYASYEVALVLDTTGSMAGGKLASMKDAVIGLIDSMALQVNDKDKLQFAMVPFATFVNVGSGFGPSFDKDGKQIKGTGAPWLDLTGAADVPQSELDAGASRFQLYQNLGLSWPGCVETRFASGTDYDIDDTPASAAKAATLYIPAFGIDEPDEPGFANSYLASDAKPNVDTAAEKKKRWKKYGVKTNNAGDPLDNGLLDPLVAGLTGNQKKVAIDASASPATGKPKGPGHGCEMQPITALNADYTSMTTKVKALQANGTTNIMEGVAWGLRVLSPGEPFDQSRKGKVGIEQVMIVLTDGSNVFGNAGNELGSGYSSFGYLTDGRIGIEAGGSGATNTLMNQRTLAACEQAKAAGIEVYTIRLEEPNVATGTMLKQCASGDDHYFDVPSRSQLDEAFGKIKERIVRVRISS